MATLKSQIQGLIDYANETTGAGDTRLGNAVKTLCDGYGQGGATLNEVDLDKAIVFMDYDGTPIASYTLAEARALTELPDNPYKEVHSRLTYQGWSHTLEEVRAFTYPQYVFAGYTTKSGAMEMVVNLNVNTGLTFQLSAGKSGGAAYINVDWGDGTTSRHYFGSLSNSTFNHTYTEYGKYVVKIPFSEDTEIQYFMTNTGRWGSQDAIDEVNASSNCCFRFYNGCVRIVSVPMGRKTLSDSGNSWLGNNAIMIVSSHHHEIKGTGYPMAGIPALAINAVFPSETTAIPTNAGTGGTGNGVIVIPSSVTTIANGAFNGSRCKCLVFEGIAPPTLGGANSITNLLKKTKIIVPDSAVDTYKSASGWTALANYIYPLSSIE